MIHVLIHFDAPPHLGGLYLHASVWVLGVKLSIHPTVYNRRHPGSVVNHPRINVIGHLQDDWSWHHSEELSVYRHPTLGTTERLSIEAWAERQVEQGPGPVFGWQEPGRAVACG